MFLSKIDRVFKGANLIDIIEINEHYIYILC